MSGYLLPFEIVSVHLLVVLIGAAYLARTKKSVPPPTDEGPFPNNRTVTDQRESRTIAPEP